MFTQKELEFLKDRNFTIREDVAYLAHGSVQGGPDGDGKLLIEIASTSGGFKVSLCLISDSSQRFYSENPITKTLDEAMIETSELSVQYYLKVKKYYEEQTDRYKVKK